MIQENLQENLQENQENQENQQRIEQRNGRKFSGRYDDPIDNLLIDLSSKVEPFFYRLNFSPNGLTTLSLLFGLMTIYLIYQKQFIGAGLSYMVSFFFDIMDGDYARRYNMTSKFGDYYDHIKDIVVGFGVLFALYQNNKFSKNVTIVIVILTLTLLSLMLIQVGCQEKYKSQIKPSNNHDSLRFLMKLCIMDPEKWLENNIFGSGFFNLYLSLLIISYSFTKK